MHSITKIIHIKKSKTTNNVLPRPKIKAILGPAYKPTLYVKLQKYPLFFVMSG